MSKSFQRFAAFCAVLAGLSGVVFTVAFTIVVQQGERWAEWASWIALLVGGLVAIPVITALYAWLREAEPEFALVAFVLGFAGSIGAAIHAAYELGVLANPSGAASGVSGVDPRGVMTFGVTGLALALFGWLSLRSERLSNLTAWLALAGGALLVVVYIARLTVLDPKTNVIRVTALVSGLAVIPAFYITLGQRLLRGGRVSAR